MNVHEYQGKEILRRFGVATSRGIPAFSVDEAVAAAKELGGPVWVVKAQIHAGGRGKGRFNDDPNGKGWDFYGCGGFPKCRRTFRIDASGAPILTAATERPASDRAPAHSARASTAALRRSGMR